MANTGTTTPTPSAPGPVEAHLEPPVEENIPITAGVWPELLFDLPFTPSASAGHPNRDHGIHLWLDEQIWGHRLWDAESPWLIFLEFLNVAEAQGRQGRLLVDDAPYPLRYRPRQRMFLRNILFNNDDVLRVAEEYPDSRRAWDEWLSRIEDKALGVPHRDFGYLRARFHTYQDFAEAVRLVRGAAVEWHRNKRWSSRFVFPFGPSSLYIDVNISLAGRQPSREYINFGRTGELLYLMLSRSSHREELEPYVRNMVAGSNRWDRLVASLQPENDDDQAQEGKSCYLPYLEHPVFDALARDWLAIFRLNLPAFDAYPHLVTLSGLHLLRYYLWIGSTWADVDTAPRLVCEIVAPKKTLVREQSLRSYGQNDALSTRAVERLVERIRGSSAWKAATESGEFSKCREVLKAAVWWGDPEEYEGPNDPDQLLQELRRVARKGHQQHVAQVHRSYGREIGLVSRRGTTRLRYAPTDELLKTLLFATVDRRMEFGQFLELLFEKYGLVIGDREAQRILAQSEVDSKAFKGNARRLEQRLSSLGLLRRLSDACAYVENPYGRALE